MRCFYDNVFLFPLTQIYSWSNCWHYTFIIFIICIYTKLIPSALLQIYWFCTFTQLHFIFAYSFNFRFRLNVANYFHDDYVSLWILLSNYTPSINTTVPYAATTSAPENSLLSSNFPKFVETRGSSIRWCFPREDFSQVNNHE